MDQIQIQLQGLGLGDYESLVLGVLLTTSPVSATYIAKQCSLSRSSVYTTLGALMSKGLVGTTYKNGVKQFVAEGPSALEALLQQEQSSLAAKFKVMEVLKTNIKSSSRVGIALPQVVFFEGQEGLKNIYLSMMRQAPKNGTRYFLRDEFVWQLEWEFLFEQEWNTTVKRWASEKKLQTKLLVNPSTLEKSKAAYYKVQPSFEYRYLPAKHSVHQFALYIIGDMIAVLSMEQHNFVGVLITNKHLAENFTTAFNVLWKAGATK